MNLETKLIFALEHVAHLEDLVEGNEYEHHLRRSICALKYEFERQLDNERHRKRRRINAEDSEMDQKVV